jgi:hypothetical protein
MKNYWGNIYSVFRGDTNHASKTNSNFDEIYIFNNKFAKF